MDAELRDALDQITELVTPAPEWQPAVLRVPVEHVPEGCSDPRFHAGEPIRVALDDGRIPLWIYHEYRLIGCWGKMVVVHPDDALRIWPDEGSTSIANCEHSILTD